MPITFKYETGLKKNSDGSFTTTGDSQKYPFDYSSITEYNDGPKDNLTQLGDIANDQFFNSGRVAVYVGKTANGLVGNYDLSSYLFYSNTSYKAGDTLTSFIADKPGDSTTYESLPCFVSGTLIMVYRLGIAIGVSVESLIVGDVLITASGEHRPICWIGHRTIDCRTAPRPQDALPIRIKAHAFRSNHPARDLFVSPGHAICIDAGGEVLIPAGSLVNGTTIAQVEVETVTYWHVELDSHDILLAEDLPCESYLEMGNRGFFHEAGVVDLAAGPDAPTRTHARFCRPFVDRGPLLDAVRTWLAGRADALEAERGQTPAVAERLAS